MAQIWPISGAPVEGRSSSRRATAPGDAARPRPELARQKGSTASSLSATCPAALFPPTLAWSHYLVLLRIQNPRARSFYEIEAARESWSVRELERQVAALLFERLSLNKSPDQVLLLARQGQEVSTPGDVLKHPFVLEFADLRANPAAHERDLEQVIIDRTRARSSGRDGGRAESA